MSRNGYIKLHRQITENELWFSERFTKSQAWIDLLLLATYEPRVVFLRGIEVKLEPGELCYSQLSLASRWKWNFKTVKSFLNMLEKREMLETRTNNVTTVISIRNWNRYQSNGDQNGDQNGDKQEGKEGKETGSPDGSPSPNQQKESKSASPVRAFETWWAEEYRRRRGEDYLFSWGKDGKLIKTMLTVCSLDQLKLKATAFLASSDEFIERAGHTIGVLYSRFNALNASDALKKEKPFGPTKEQTIFAEVDI